MIKHNDEIYSHYMLQLINKINEIINEVYDKSNDKFHTLNNTIFNLFVMIISNIN